MEIWLGDIFIKNFSIEDIEKDYSESFLNDLSFDTVKIKQGVKRIGNNMFRNCFSLINVELPEGLLTIGINAFNKCYKIVKITLPKSLQKLETGCFDNCNSITIYAYKKFDKYQNKITILASTVSKPQQIKKNIMKNYIKLVKEYRLKIIYPELSDRTIDELETLNNSFDNIIKCYIALNSNIKQVNNFINIYNSNAYDSEINDIINEFNSLKPNTLTNPIDEEFI